MPAIAVSCISFLFILKLYPGNIYSKQVSWNVSDNIFSLSTPKGTMFTATLVNNSELSLKQPIQCPQVGNLYSIRLSNSSAGNRTYFNAAGDNDTTGNENNLFLNLTDNSEEAMHFFFQQFFGPGKSSSALMTKYKGNSYLLHYKPPHDQDQDVEDLGLVLVKLRSRPPRGSLMLVAERK